MQALQPTPAAAPPVLWWLRLEGLAVAIHNVVLYARTGSSWWLLAALWLAPDLSILGYLANPRIGAAIYNLFHLPLWPAVLIFTGWFAAEPLAMQIGLIWLCHLGLDHLAGYGFKYPTEFKDTHLQHV